MPIEFYKVTERPYGCFSNFSEHGFELDGAWWPTSEHYFQAQKFAGTPHVEELRQAKSAMKVAQLGRERHRPLRPDWEAVKDDVMLRALMAKFSAHADIREILLSTGDEHLVEATTTDYYWGRGTDGSGKNMLGLLLVQVREALRG
jgi:ribA/ribD-fused uncharacterized protein